MTSPAKQSDSGFRPLLIVLAFTLPIPLLGLLTATGIQASLNSKYESAIIENLRKEKGIDIRERPEILEKISLASRCSDFEETSSELRAICSTRSNLEMFSFGAIVTLIATGFLLASIIAAGHLCKLNRLLLLTVFRLGLWVTQLGVATLVLANAFLLIATIYWAESWLVGRVHFALIATLGTGAIIGALSICLSAFKFTHKAQARVFGRRLIKSDHPKLWTFVENIAKEAGTQPPDQIVVGLDPNFFVTETAVLCLDGNLNGRSLYLSLPLCRVLTQKELAAVIGHELGHFVGMDTRFSRWFFPIFRGSTETLELLSSGAWSKDNGLQGLAFLPSLLIMDFFLRSFSKAEATISRERELNADKLGAKIAGTEAMGTCLIKVHAYTRVWAYTRSQMKEALQEGKQLTNASAFFSKTVALLEPEFFEQGLETTRTSHPTDSHPVLSSRIDSLGLNLIQAIRGALRVPESDQRAIDVVDHYEKLELELSDLEHHKMVKLGMVKVGDSTPAEAEAVTKVKSA